VAPGRVLLARAPPPPDDARGWGEAVAQIVRAGWDGSEAVRHAGAQAVMSTLFDELFSHLDPYSRYVPPSIAEADRDRRDGQGGIGVQVALRHGDVLVQSVADDSPAGHAGVHAGDRILAIDGAPVDGADLAAVTALLAGPAGTEVSLTLRGADRRPRTATMARAVILPRTVTGARVGDLLVLRVSGFTGDTGARLAEALVQGLGGARPARGVVIDLRGNRGGLLRQAVAAAETMLPRGLVAATAGRDPDAAHQFVADGADLSHGLPAVVVVDGRSASAAEILAAALADQHRAVVVGSTTLGKGLVQTIAPLPDGGELFVTWSRVLAPLGWPIQGLGVLPQVCTSLGEEALRRQVEALSHGEQSMAPALLRHRAARPPLPVAEILDIRNVCPAAEGRDLDLAAARRLLHDPPAYAAALLGPPPARGGAQDLTSVPAMGN
jgi:carboxyl-terminal processing protease